MFKHAPCFSAPTLTCAMLAGIFALTLSTRAEARSHDDDAGDHHGGSGVGRPQIAVDFDFVSALNADETKSGGGGALRLGSQLDLFLVTLTPEIGGSYHAFGGNDDTRVYTGFLGGRFAVGKIIEPSIFGHVGIGHVDGLETRTAPVMDIGLALDFTLLPLIDLGLHGAYDVMLPRSNGTALKFMNLGAQAALVF